VSERKPGWPAHQDFVRLFSHNFDFGFSKTSSNTANGPSEGAVGAIEEGRGNGEEGNILRAREKGLRDSQGRKKAPVENTGAFFR
ncbi:MAG TPA: hypothetical protein PL015_11525, partial [Opitutaceae bacterium]|nr:hypothetical protein [Opitutaceae bacterium]